KLESQIDYVLLTHQIEFELATLGERERHEREMQTLLPFAPRPQQLQLTRRDRPDADATVAAQVLEALARDVDAIPARRGGPAASAAELRRAGAVVGYRAADHLSSLENTLQQWYGFYAGYDPLFTWWVEKPHARLETALQQYRQTIRRELVGIRDGGIDPI